MPKSKPNPAVARAAKALAHSQHIVTVAAKALAHSQHIVTVAAKALAFDRIADLLYPQTGPDKQWQHNTIEMVAEYVLAVYPGADRGDRTFNPDSVKA